MVHGNLMQEVFGVYIEEAVRPQKDGGLRVVAVCGPAQWEALVLAKTD